MRERRRRRLPATAVVLTISACGPASTAVATRAEAAEASPVEAVVAPIEASADDASSGAAPAEPPPKPPPMPLNPPPPRRNPPPPPPRIEAPPLAPGDVVRRNEHGACVFEPRRGESRPLEDCPTDLRMTGFLSRAPDGQCRVVREFGGCPPGATCNPPPPLKLDCPPGSPPLPSRKPSEPEGGR